MYNAINENGTVGTWQCAVYYNGANGTKNPFMQSETFSDLITDLKLLKARLRLHPKPPREYLIIFSSLLLHICISVLNMRRAYDAAWYMHLEEKGPLNKKFNHTFRTRGEWKFDIKDFE